ncbi:MAG: hypothetical protein V6Z86_01510 [Hyphomicrobiales bacterium]
MDDPPPDLQHEVFDPAGIIVECGDTGQMLQLAENLAGQLTATLHLEKTDHALAAELTVILEGKARRLLCNGFSTGVEVCSAMMHGGPYPASTDIRATSGRHACHRLSGFSKNASASRNSLPA